MGRYFDGTIVLLGMRAYDEDDDTKDLGTKCDIAAGRIFQVVFLNNM